MIMIMIIIIIIDDEPIVKVTRPQGALHYPAGAPSWSVTPLQPLTGNFSFNLFCSHFYVLCADFT